MYSVEKIQELVKDIPILKNIIDLKPVTWLNLYKKPMAEVTSFPLELADMKAAEDLWKRFAPFFATAFPETASTNGKVESPLKEISKMKADLSQDNTPIQGRLLLKCDSHLAVAGSIKARGGFYEILHYAETLALKKNMISQTDDYRIFSSEEFKSFFSQYTIGVGSTGNLGLSIGIISAKLGFKVKVYVSSDAKKWKKDLLRSKGVEVMECPGDFSIAIAKGREETKADEMGYFVDDENSKHLYLGYSVGALRLAKQLEEQGIHVDAEHPLFVYSPCGVGGSPGGLAAGLKRVFGDAVHCFFVEPTHSPAVLLGLTTQKMGDICVQDVGIDNKTEADGLAVGRPSRFATAISGQLISGVYTLEDKELYQLLARLKDTEDIFLEPSATAGLIGPQRIAQTEYAEVNQIDMTKVTHIAWATGGGLVPEKECAAFYEKGKTTAY